jgi:LysR family transcriptional activator of nhaA
MSKSAKSDQWNASAEWLNYHHLYYFWEITRRGGVTHAAEALNVSHSTLSTQLQSLETFLGAPLFERRGRRLVITPFGTEMAKYAEEIFRMGGELVNVARGREGKEPQVLRIGIVGGLPHTVVQRFLEPVVCNVPHTPVQVRQGSPAQLLKELAAHRLHGILSDTPAPASLRNSLHSQLVGETELWLYASRRLATRYRKGFPRSLMDAPLLLPGGDAAMRRNLERWFTDHDLRPRLVGEFDDVALMRSFGALGVGLFPVRSTLRAEVEETYRAEAVGRLEGLHERYYVISVERRVRHRDVARLVHEARSKLAANQLGLAGSEEPR